jgi:predicted Zn-dependent protease
VGLFYDLGRLAGRNLIKAKWMVNSLAGSESERIAAEFAYGHIMAATYCERSPVDEASPFGATLREIGERLASRLTDTRRVFHFYGDATASPNAFALPGGFIFVSRALADLCASDRDELAFVLAHEIAHVAKGHASGRFVTSLVLDLASRHGMAGGPVKAALSTLMATLVSRGYSQDDELEADVFGARLTASAGFDASGGVRLLEHLASALGGPDGPGQYFSTHPSFEKRLARLQRPV